MDIRGETSTTSRRKWREDFLESIRVVLHEYDDVFPQNLPKGLPPMRKGHEFKVKLEDDVPLIH